MKHLINNKLVIIPFIIIASCLNSCSEKQTLPVLSTTVVTNINSNWAISGGNITDDGGNKVMYRGVCWSTSINPDLNSNTSNDGPGTGPFVSLISGLTESTTYYVRAYATNSEGTGYGNEISFTTRQLSLPGVTTNEPALFGTTYLVAEGKITDDGGGIDLFGMCWNTSPLPTVNDNVEGVNQSGVGTYTCYVSGLSPGTTYYFRFYATNYAGTAYGNEVSFTAPDGHIVFNPELTYGSVIDVEGNVYKTIMIGTQTWMAENLRTTKYSDGTPITIPGSFDEWSNLTETGKACCFYKNNSEEYSFFGAYYTWAAAMNGNASTTANPSGVQGVCPDGWHIPSIAEWDNLVNNLGGEEIAGGKMKEAGYSHWMKYDEIIGRNESGFTGLPGGHCDDGFFGEDAWIGMWWSSSQMTGTPDPIWSDIAAWDYRLGRGSNYAEKGYSYKKSLRTVRCVKD